MVGPALPGANITGSIKLTGVSQFLADADKITKRYNQIAQAAQNASKVVSRSPIATATPSASGAGGIRPRAGGFTGVSARAGPFQTALGVGGFGGGALSVATAGFTALAVAVAATTAAVLKLGSSFQAGQRSIQVFGQASNAEMTEVNDKVLELAARWGTAPAAINAGALSLIKAGNSIEQVNAGLLENVVVLERASEGEVEMAQGADLLTQLMTIYTPELAKAAEKTGDYSAFQAAATKTTDTLVGAVQNSTAGFKEFSLQLKFVSPVAKIMGVSFEDTAAQLAVLNNAGIRGETAGTALRNAWLRMIKPTQDAQEAMTKFGISVINTGDEMVDAEHLVKQLETAFGDEAVATGRITEGQRAQALARIFNTRQILAGVAIAQQGTEAFTRMQQAQSRVSAKEIASGLQFGIIKQIGLLATQIEVVALKAFTQFDVALTNILVTINEFARASGIQEFAASIGATINSIITLQNPFINAWLKMSAAVDILVIKGLGNFLTSTGKVLNAIFGGLIPSADQAGGFLQTLADIAVTAAAAFEVFTAMALEFSDNTVAAVGIVRATAVEVFNAIVAQGEKSMASLGKIFSDLVTIAGDPVTFFKGIFDSIVTAVTEAVPVILAELNILTNGISGFIIKIVGDFISLHEPIVQVAQSIINTFVGMAPQIIAGLSFIADTIISVFTTVSTVVIDAITAVGAGTIQAFNFISNIFVQSFNGLITTVGTAVQGILAIWNFLSGGLLEVVTSGIVPVLDSLILAVQRVVSPIIDAIVTWVKGWGVALTEWVRIVKAAVNSVIGALRRIARIGSNLPGLSAINAAFNFFDELSGRIEAAGGSVSAAGENLQADLGNLAKGVASAASVGAGIISKAATDFSDRVTKQIDATRASVNEAFAKLQATLQRPRPEPAERKPTTARPVTGTGSPAFPPGKDKGGGGGGRAEDIDLLAQRIFDALSGIIPNMTKDLAEFMAGIAKDFPARLQPMIDALIESRSIIGEMVLLKREMVGVDIELIGVEKRIATLQREQSRLQLQADIASIGFDKQLLSLGFEKLQIERQMWPLEDAIRDIDEEINKLSRENLVLTRARLEIEIKMLPIKHQIEDIEKRINDLQQENLAVTAERLVLEARALPLKQAIAVIDERLAQVGRRNFALERETLDLTKASLPLRRQIQLLEDQITDSVDRRQQLLSRKTELLAEKDVSKLENQLKAVENQLTTAWTNFDVPTILKLEESKRLLEEQLKAAQTNLDKVTAGQEEAARDTELANLEIELQIVALENLLKPLDRRQQAIEHTQAVQENLNAITKLGLEEQRAALEALLVPTENYIALIDRLLAAEELRVKTAVNGLEQEKRILEDSLKPLNDKLIAIQREVETENLRNSLTITHLEEEKRKLEDQLRPLENQRRAIERTTKEIEFQRTAARIQFEEQMLQVKEKLLREQDIQLELEDTRKKQEEVFLALLQHFLDSMTASGAFSLQEAIEVNKRLELWDSQNDKLLENVTMFGRLSAAADVATDAINKIPREVKITVTTIYETKGSPGPGTPRVGPITVDPNPALPPGNPVPDAPPVDPNTGAPIIDSAPAADSFIRRNNFIGSREATAGSNISIVTNNITNFQVNPSYSQVDSPVSIREDLRALVMAMK